MALASLLGHALPLDSTSGAGLGVAGIVFTIIYIAVIVLEIASLWVIFTKAGKPGWAAIIPIYNTIVLLQVAGRPIWWFILLLIPFVNIVILILVMIDLSRSFGHGGGFAAGLILLSLIFFPILAFGSSQYVGPRGLPAGGQMQMGYRG
ncbi:MAG TPA: DUF5684 domain-containing protein [Ktedonobacterales bacterium]|jgi:hypothetical protein|nr:DUF5684 domain-containing protein [Ktedonobacterales bacterium]